MAATDTVLARTPGAGAHDAPAPGLPATGLQTVTGARSATGLPAVADIAVIGGGCSGLATAVRLAAGPSGRSVVVLEGHSGPDPRSWCSWDDGSDPLPEARSASWSRWEVRTDRGTSTGVDAEHPYVLVRAADRWAAAQRRLTGGPVQLLDGVPVSGVVREHDALEVHTAAGPVRAETVLDARGPRCPEHVGPGRVLLHQRFVGRWIATDRPVFDPTTVTLMDFTAEDAPGRVHFVYVLPVSPTEALVESTLFTPDAADPLDHRAAITAYVGRRWGLPADAWHVVEEERGCIPMTDVPPVDLAGSTDPRWHPAGAEHVATVVGTTRPSSGYGFARSNRHSVAVARHLADGTPVPAFRDRARTRFLDAVFLRVLRDRPEQAAEAFRRLVALPGPLVVRFMGERSTPVDDLRIVLALQKAPFLAALVRTLADAAVRLGPAGRRRA